MTDEQQLASLIRKNLSIPEFLEYSQRLYDLEKSVCHKDFDASTRYCMQVMQEAGFEDVERLEMPCDGRNSVRDTVMPQAWDRTGRCYLEIAAPDYAGGERILADTDERPLSAATWSAPTPPEGVTGELAKFSDCDPDSPDVRGKFVFYPANARGEVYYKCAQSGALGMVCSDLEQGEDYPDSIRWMNGPGRSSWYHVREDRKIPVFVLTPRKARWLLEEMEKHPLVLHGVMNTRISDGKIYTVTARIPGEEPEEMGLIAHIYEPFLNDDASGFAAVVILGKLLKQLQQQGMLRLRKSVRLAVSMELYGFSRFFSDPARAGKIFAAHNLDAICCKPIFGDPQRLRMSALCNPYFGDLELRRLLREILPHIPFVQEHGNLSDDTFGSDPQLDIPTLWLYNVPEKFHHCTCPAFADIDPGMAEDILTLLGVHLAELLGDNRQELAKRVCQETCGEYAAALRKIEGHRQNGTLAERQANFRRYAARILAEGRIRSLNRLESGLFSEKEMARELDTFGTTPSPCSWKEGLSPVQQQAAGMVVTRLVPGFPFSFARIPHEKRPASRQGSMLLFALCDGKRSLWECAGLAGSSRETEMTDEDLQSLIHYIEMLADYGYFRIDRT